MVNVIWNEPFLTLCVHITHISFYIQNMNDALIRTILKRWFEITEVCTTEVWRAVVLYFTAWHLEVLSTLWVPRFGRQFSTAWATPGFFSFPSLNIRTGIRDGTCRHTDSGVLDEGTAEWNKNPVFIKRHETEERCREWLMTIRILKTESYLRLIMRGTQRTWVVPAEINVLIMVMTSLLNSIQ